MTPEFRLVAVDLDGTLLSSSGVISSVSRRSLAACADAGIHVAIVTGRRFPAMRSFVDELSRETLVVANSGALVMRGVRGPILRRRLLPRETAEAGIAIASRSAMEPVVHDGPDAEGNLILRESAREMPHLGRYLRNTSPEPSWVSSIRLERDPIQIGFAGSLESIRELETRLTRELEDRLHTPSFARTEYPSQDLALLDVLGSEATKSSALLFLVDYLGLKPSQSIAIGDNWNDLGMLETAGMGVVMANAVAGLLSRDFAKTGSNDNDGVAEAIRRYVLET